MKSKFNGVLYQIETEPIGGLCTPPDGNCQPTIYIPDGLHNNMKCLIKCIHEGRHAGKFDTSEAKVDRLSRDLGRYLWRLGWRLK